MSQRYGNNKKNIFSSKFAITYSTSLILMIKYHIEAKKKTKQKKHRNKYEEKKEIMKMGEDKY